VDPSKAMNFPGSRIEAAEVVAVIPARFGSTRFPGKALAPLWGRPMIAHVVEAARAAQRVGTVLVATDDERIAAAARQAGAEAVLTRADHPTGSDRIGEAIQGGDWPVVLNVQGDEPLVPPAAIDRLVALLEQHPEAAASTLATPLAMASDAHLSPHVVKVVCDAAGWALYFSRAPIPGRHPHPAEARGDVPSRTGREAQGRSGADRGEPPARETDTGSTSPLRHVGLYGFRRNALERFLGHTSTPLERIEGLEQLRLLEMGERIVVGAIDSLPPGVDTPDDLAWLQSLDPPKRE